MLSGLGFINFICPKNLQTAAENVCNLKFQHKAVTIFQRASVKETVNHSERKQIVKITLQNFMQRGKICRGNINP